MSPRAAFRCAEGWFQVSLRSTGRGKRLLARGRADARPSRCSAMDPETILPHSGRRLVGTLALQIMLCMRPHCGKFWSAVTRAALCAGRGTAFSPRRERRHTLSRLQSKPLGRLRQRRSVGTKCNRRSAGTKGSKSGVARNTACRRTKSFTELAEHREGQASA